MGLQRVGTTELPTLNYVLIDHQGALWTTFCADAGFLYRNLPHAYTSGSAAKKPACNAGDTGSIPGSERYPGEGNGNPLSHSSILPWETP